MSTNYPGALDSYSTKVDGVDDVLAAHINNPQDAIEAIEAELGTDPAGTFTTVKLRLEKAYGSFYSNTTAWSQAAVAETWYNIIDASIADGQLYKVTHDGNGKLTTTVAGIFLVNYSLTFQSNGANDHVEVGIEVTGSGSADANGQAHSESKFANQEEPIASTCILSLAANATLEVAIRTEDGGTTLSVQHINLTAYQIRGT